MRIYKGQTLGGYPITFLQHVCRTIHTAPEPMTIDAVIDAYLLSPGAIVNAVSVLRVHDYLTTDPDEPRQIITTLKGGALVNASSARKMTRKQATTLLAQVIDRVRTINRSRRYLYTVSRVQVFGSYAKGATYCSDLDLRIELTDTPRASSPPHLAACLKRAPKDCHRDPKWKDWWPQDEVHRAIKHRHPQISLHLPHDAVFDEPSCTLIDVYPDHVLTQEAS